jgi:hypothetical protein
MANMAVEVAQLRIEVDALLKENPPKGFNKPSQTRSNRLRRRASNYKKLIRPDHLPRVGSIGDFKTFSITVA